MQKLKLIISSEHLKPILNKMSQVMLSKPVLPITSNLLFKVNKESIEVIGTNIEISVIHKLKCDTTEVFDFLIPFEFINKIVALYKNYPLELEIGKKIKVKVDGDVFEIKQSGKVEDYPKHTELSSPYTFNISDEVVTKLKTAVYTTAGGGANVNSNLSHVLLELELGKLVVASSDGAYMVYSIEFETPEINKEAKILLPQKFIKILEGTNSLTLSFNDDKVLMYNDTISVIASRSVHKFPQYRKVFPEDWPQNTSIDKETLVAALEKCSLSNDELHTTILDLSKKNSIELKANDSVLNVNVTIEGTYSGNVESTKINAEKLSRLLEQISGDNIYLAINDPNKAIVITSDEQGYKGMIMPISQ